MSHRAAGVNAHRRATVDCYARDTENISSIPTARQKYVDQLAHSATPFYGVAGADEPANTIT